MLLILLLLVVFICHAHGMVAPEGWCDEFELKGGCGKIVCISLVGTPFVHTFRSQDGYSLCLRHDNDNETLTQRTFVFMDENGNCGFQEYRCGNEVPRSQTRGVLKKFLLPKSEYSKKVQEFGPLYGKDDLPTSKTFTLKSGRNLQQVGRYRNLVLLIRWSDHTTRNLPTKADYEVLFNSDMPDPDLAPTGSVKQFLHRQYYDKIQIENVIVDWIDVPFTEREAAGEVQPTSGNACQAMCSGSQLRDALVYALTKAQQRVSFQSLDLDQDGWIDMITFLHSGYGAEFGGDNIYRVWSHKWTLPSVWSSSPSSGRKRVYHYNISPGTYGTAPNYDGTHKIARIGTISHEMNHYINLPDLYDADGGGYGIGLYGLMSSAWGLDFSQLYPPSLSAWSKVALGVVTPTDLEQSGRIYVPPVQDTDVDSILRVRTKYPNGTYAEDYLLIENRARKLNDKYLGGGFLIYHIDPYETPNSNQGFPGDGSWPENHYMVRLIQADQKYELDQGHNQGSLQDFFNEGKPALDDFSVQNLRNYELYGTNLCSGHVFKDWRHEVNGTMSFEYQNHQIQSCDQLLLGPTKSPTAKSPTTATPTVGTPTTATPTVGTPTTATPTVGTPPTATPTVVTPTTKSPTTKSPTTNTPAPTNTKAPSVAITTTSVPTKTPILLKTDPPTGTTTTTESPTAAPTNVVITSSFVSSDDQSFLASRKGQIILYGTSVLVFSALVGVGMLCYLRFRVMRQEPESPTRKSSTAEVLFENQLRMA